MNETIFKVTDDIIYIGVDDPTLDIFESQYDTPDGITYNSYLVKGEKTAVIDTTDDRTGEQWLYNLRKALEGVRPDYLVIEHMEPDHSSLIATFLEIYPATTLLLTAAAAKMLPLYVERLPETTKIQTVADGETIDLGGLTLQFHTAPMVHWPEVMMIYCPEHKLLFSADAFGTFGTMTTPRTDWATEARRYYYNIVGKYGAQVQAVLKKLSTLPIDIICPLHGPIISGRLTQYIALYDKWSRYEPEKEGVFIACASIHGNTLSAAEFLARQLRKKGVADVRLIDLTRSDLSQAVAEAFMYPKAVLCASSYDAGLFTPMHRFLHTLKTKGYCNRDIAIIENGSWAPTAAKTMRAMLEGFKGLTFIGDAVTIRGAFKESDHAAIEELADEITKN